MMHIRYRILTWCGIWFTGIYAEDGELVDIEMKQTLIRRFLNWVWNFLHRYGVGVEEPCPHRDFPEYIPIRKRAMKAILYDKPVEPEVMMIDPPGVLSEGDDLAKKYDEQLKGKKLKRFTKNDC